MNNARPGSDDTALPPYFLSAYQNRIGWPGPDAALERLAPTLDTLTGLHQAHTHAIPFENVDVQLGRPIHLDLPNLKAKLLDAGRGGYCFEHNTLFLTVLRALGFQVTTLAGRVRYLANGLPPRTHMILRVNLPDGPYLADVGFGGFGTPCPLRFTDAEQPTSHDVYRLLRENMGGLSGWVLQVNTDNAWQDLYAFTEEEHFPIDYQVANHFTSTHPQSRFKKNLMVTLLTTQGRLVLRDQFFGERKQGKMERRALSPDEVVNVLGARFGIHLPPGTRLGAPDLSGGQAPAVTAPGC